MNLLNLNTMRVLRLACAVLLMMMMAACGGGGGGPEEGTEFISGTASEGASMAGALITIACPNTGTFTATADSQGNYVVRTIWKTGRCLITAQLGNVTLVSMTTGNPCSCRYNTNPLTTMALRYTAAQLNISFDVFLATFTTNNTIQIAVSNQNVINNAINQINLLISNNFNVLITVNYFITTIIINQGVDFQVDELETDGAIEPDGEPNPNLINEITDEGEANPIKTGGATGGTGGSGGSGAGSCGCSA